MSTTTRLTALLSRRPILSFFVLAYGLSWLFWSPYVLGQDGIGVLPFHIPKLAGSSQVIGMLPGAFLGPITAAFVVTAVAGGRPGLREWRSRLLRFRAGVHWYGLALVGVPAVLLLSCLLLPGAAGEFRLPSAGLLLTYVPVLVLQVFTSALAEEPGWRDFALPRLQRRYGPLVGTSILGLLWAGWHLPLFLTSPWGDGAGLSALAVFVVFCVAVSVVITWVFNNTGGSVPLIMLLHASINAFSLVLAPAFYPGLSAGYTAGGGANALGLALFALVIIAFTRGRLSYGSAGRTRRRGVPESPDRPQTPTADAAKYP